MGLGSFLGGGSPEVSRYTGSRVVFRPWIRLHYAAAVVLAGIVVGLAWATEEIWFNQYIDTGYWRNATLLLRQLVLVAAALACAAALAGIAAKFIATLLMPASERFFSVSRLIEIIAIPRYRYFAYAVVLIAAAYYFVHGQERFSVAKPDLYVLLVVLIVATEVLGLWTKRRPDPGSLRARQITGAVYAFIGVWALNEWLFLGLKPQLASGSPEWRARLLLTMLAAAVTAGLVWRHLRTVEATPGTVRRRAAILTTTALVLISAVIVAPMFAPTQPVGNPKNVLLIGVDTLRADHTSLVGPSGADRALTPNLAALAKNGAVFTNAMSQSPWTLPSFATVLTGLYPHEHAALDFGDYLPRHAQTISERFREAGYDTAAFVSHRFVTRRHGFEQGYDHFNEKNHRGEKAITAHGVTDEAIRWLEGAGEQPFFMFLHYFDPHYEYRDHEDLPYADGYEGWIDRTNILIGNLLSQRAMLDEEDIAYLKNLYDEEIEYTDRHIGRLIEYLRERGLLEDTAIVFFSDHGEEFMEHGSLDHTTTLYEEVINVPLMVSLPDKSVPLSPIAETVETRDIYNLLVQYADLPQDDALAPSTLLAHMEAGHVVASSEREAELATPSYAFSTVWLPNARIGSGKRVQLASLRTNQWKLIFDVGRGRHFLFDMEADPGELKNLASEAQPELARMRAQLDAWLAKMIDGYKPLASGSMDQQTINELEALGYL